MLFVLLSHGLVHCAGLQYGRCSRSNILPLSDCMLAHRGTWEGGSNWK